MQNVRPYISKRREYERKKKLIYQLNISVPSNPQLPCFTGKCCFILRIKTFPIRSNFKNTTKQKHKFIQT